MASRTLDTATAAAIVGPTLFLAWIIQLNFVGDPVYINSGLLDLYFASGLGYDPILVGNTYKGVGNIGTIDPIVDDVSGSDTMTLTLPGVNLANDYLKQIMTNGDLWQRQQGYVWFVLTTNNGTIIGLPTRVKTARIDQLTMSIDPDKGSGTLVVALESQQSYSGDALATRWSNQPDVDPTDLSQQYVADLANKTIQLGNGNSNASSQANKGVPLSDLQSLINAKSGR